MTHWTSVLDDHRDIDPSVRQQAVVSVQFSSQLELVDSALTVAREAWYGDRLTHSEWMALCHFIETGR